ncbi:MULTISPECIES: type IV secretory system conjugative DNA transfer family protein, partial [unclassified Sphingobium]|uniref:type IV secretory system conjugative DNA transfer family protein n=1 Tax=unclassified Sphingobium TaxID=2611147 RepID=UPI0035A6B5FF
QRAMRNYAGHRLAPWLAHVMVSRQETARALLTPGEVMQLPATDELVLVAGTPPIRATKLRYFEDSNFKARVLPPPTLASGDCADRPPARPDVWTGTVRGTDARLGAGEEEVGGDAGGGLEQARQPGQEIDRPLTPDPVTTDPLGLGADDDDAAADQRAMDQARALGTARTVYAIDAGADGSNGHRPGDLQLDL